MTVGATLGKTVFSLRFKLFVMMNSLGSGKHNFCQRYVLRLLYFSFLFLSWYISDSFLVVFHLSAVQYVHTKQHSCSGDCCFIWCVLIAWRRAHTCKSVYIPFTILCASLPFIHASKHYNSGYFLMFSFLVLNSVTSFVIIAPNCSFYFTFVDSKC